MSKKRKMGGGTLDAAEGAVSRESKASASPESADRTTMKAPPPIPLDTGCTTPRHSAAATAASTAWPPARSAATPISEHRPSSAATTPTSDSTTSGPPVLPHRCRVTSSLTSRSPPRDQMSTKKRSPQAAKNNTNSLQRTQAKRPMTKRGPGTQRIPTMAAAEDHQMRRLVAASGAGAR